MVFSSIFFLFFFLPVALFLSYIAPKKLKNFVLLAMSLLFYFWGEGYAVFYLLYVSLIVYVSGLGLEFLDRNPLDSRSVFFKKVLLFCAIGANLSLLGYYKYANFFVEEILVAAKPLGDWEHVALPIGISFFTFQAISYVIDVYRAEIRPAKKFTDLACYICSFPQLVAGPIVRYIDIEAQIEDRKMDFPGFAKGANRFFIGLAKKVLIANPLAQCADTLFSLSSGKLGGGEAWLGAISYTLQIYYDFSGYSDMAIGLGLMLGFTFPENFNYPYISQSIQDFWRRWHISLSTWFRDYLYIPLGGNRSSTVRTYFNLWVVFFLCGFWHGAAWSFIVWGIYHGAFLVLERIAFAHYLAKVPRIMRHGYALLVIVAGWVFFRADTVGQALDFFVAGAGFSPAGTNLHQLAGVLSNDVIAALCLGGLFSTPLYPFLAKKLQNLAPASLQQSAHSVALVMIYFLCLFRLSADTYNPFLYFRF